MSYRCFSTMRGYRRSGGCALVLVLLPVLLTVTAFSPVPIKSVISNDRAVMSSLFRETTAPPSSSSSRRLSHSAVSSGGTARRRRRRWRREHNVVNNENPPVPAGTSERRHYCARMRHIVACWMITVLVWGCSLWIPEAHAAIRTKRTKAPPPPPPTLLSKVQSTISQEHFLPTAGTVVVATGAGLILGRRAYSSKNNNAAAATSSPPDIHQATVVDEPETDEERKRRQQMVQDALDRVRERREETMSILNPEERAHTRNVEDALERVRMRREQQETTKEEDTVLEEERQRTAAYVNRILKREEEKVPVSRAVKSTPKTRTPPNDDTPLTPTPPRTPVPSAFMSVDKPPMDEFVSTSSSEDPSPSSLDKQKYASASVGSELTSSEEKPDSELPPHNMPETTTLSQSVEARVDPNGTSQQAAGPAPKSLLTESSDKTIAQPEKAVTDNPSTTPNTSLRPSIPTKLDSVGTDNPEAEVPIVAKSVTESVNIDAVSVTEEEVSTEYEDDKSESSSDPVLSSAIEDETSGPPVAKVRETGDDTGIPLALSAEESQDLEESLSSALRETNAPDSPEAMSEKKGPTSLSDAPAFDTQQTNLKPASSVTTAKETAVANPQTDKSLDRGDVSSETSSMSREADDDAQSGETLLPASKITLVDPEPAGIVAKSEAEVPYAESRVDPSGETSSRTASAKAIDLSKSRTSLEVKDETNDDPEQDVKALNSGSSDQRGTSLLAVKETKDDYVSSDSLEESAFSVLVDLGMVELHPDPSSTDYDSTMDDEFVN